jgi:hypothetical protein
MKFKKNDEDIFKIGLKEDGQREVGLGSMLQIGKFFFQFFTYKILRRFQKKKNGLEINRENTFEIDPKRMTKEILTSILKLN